MTRSYDSLAFVYDLLGELYSLGAIRRTKVLAARSARAPSRVLIAGSGTAHEAPVLVDRGSEVTLLDPSGPMLDRARHRLREAMRERPEAVHFVQQTWHQYRPEGTFDAVFAPFFLNIFAKDELPSVLGRLPTMLSAGGRFIVADFARPRAGWLGALQRLYYLPPLGLFSALGAASWHELYDYSLELARAGLPFVEVERTAVLLLGVPLYEVTTYVLVS